MPERRLSLELDAARAGLAEILATAHGRTRDRSDGDVGDRIVELHPEERRAQARRRHIDVTRTP